MILSTDRTSVIGIGAYLLLEPAVFFQYIGNPQVITFQHTVHGTLAVSMGGSKSLPRLES
jgi:hypothetical protein